jgi:signal transduction histidine kinase
LRIHPLYRDAINGSTGAVLGRSLLSLRDLVASTLSEIRIAAIQQQRERVFVTPFLTEIAVHPDARGLSFVVELGDPAWTVTADPQLLASAVTNLLNSVFKFTATDGRVVPARKRGQQRSPPHQRRG